MFEGFLHPALVWGTALASVPLLIHLLNRQRHKPLRWAAMQFVLAAYKRTRRRAQMENLLLLLLRMAAVALLALAISRPFTGEDSPLAPLTESRRDVVLIIDGSASTGYREGVQSVYESIVERARDLLTSFDGTRGDRVRFVTAAAQPRLLSARSPEDATVLATTLTSPTDEPLDLAAVLTEVVAYAEEEVGEGGQSSLEVRLLTDLQRRSFVPEWTPTVDTEKEPGDDAPPLVRALDRLDELGIRLIVEDLGASALTPPNMGIEEIEAIGEIIGPGILTEISVRVRNSGSAGRAAVRVALEVDGERQPSQKVDVTARATSEVVFPVLFKSSGPHSLVARLEGDRLAVDDMRATVVHVPAPVRLLLVNGDPNPEIDRDELGFVRAILEPPDDSLGVASQLFAPFAISEVRASAFGDEEFELGDYDVVLMANVSSLSARMVERLEERIAGGGALIITLGDRVADSTAIEGINSRLWRSDQTGLLPARLFRAVEVKSRRDAYYRCAWFDEEHPVLAFFADERWRPYFTEIPIYAFVSSEPYEDTRVLARLDDENRSPLLLEREYDRGRVFLWTTSIDRDWNRIPESPSTLIPLLHELLRYAGRGLPPTYNVDVGGTLALEVGAFPLNPFLVGPKGSRRRLDGEPLEIGKGVWRLPPVSPLERSGLWHVEWEGAEIPFAVNIDPLEGDLERMVPSELNALHRVIRVVQPSEAEEADDEEDDQPRRGEIWRWLASLALIALILETLWAAWIGRGRRVS